MHIVAYDPGKITGVAVGTTFGNSLTVYTLSEISTEKIWKWRNMIDISDDVVIEQPFNSGPQMCLDAFEIYGFLTYYAKGHHKNVIRSQPSSLEFAKTRFPEIKMTSHWGDALSHLILHCYRQYDIREVKVHQNALVGNK